MRTSCLLAVTVLLLSSMGIARGQEVPFEKSYSIEVGTGISAVLKSFHNIPTKTPKCPCPKNNNIIIPDLCAVSDESALNHSDAMIGENNVSHNIRNILMRKMTNKYNYPLLNSIKPEYVSKIHIKYKYGNKRPLFNLSDDLWKGAAYCQ